MIEVRPAIKDLDGVCLVMWSHLTRESKVESDIQFHNECLYEMKIRHKENCRKDRENGLI